MRHGIAGNRLGRNPSLRKATIRDIAKATLIRQRVCTTKAKAKEARKLLDRLITLGKKGELAHKRKAFSILNDHQLVSDLFNKTAPRFKERNGGYSRIILLSTRKGDNAQLAYLELTEKEEMIISKAKSSATKKSKDLKVEPTTAQPAGDSQQKGQSTTDTSAQKKTPKPPIKLPTKKHEIAPEKGKSGKKIVGGIKKMFQRKVAE